LKKQLKAAKKVLALKKALAKVCVEERAAVRAKIATAKKVLKKATKKVRKVTRRIAFKKGKFLGEAEFQPEGVSYLSPVVREGIKLTQEQKEALNARSNEAFDLSTLDQIEDRDEALD